MCFCTPECERTLVVFHTDRTEYAKATCSMEVDGGAGRHFDQKRREDRCKGRAPRGGGRAPTRACQPYQGAAVATATAVCFL